MSGALSTVLGVDSAAGSVFSLLTGASLVTLGTIAFQSFEVPQSIRWGGKQAMKVHQFPGGPRVIDVTGPEEDAISWSGIMLGSNSSARANALDIMRRTGALVLLSWGDFSASVVVDACSFDQRYQQIAYSISCMVLPDDGAGIGGIAPSPLEAINDDVNNALGFDLVGSLGAAATQAQAVQTALAPIVGVISPSAAVSVSGAMTSAIGSLVTMQAAADAGITVAADATNVVSSLPALRAALDWNGLGANAASAAGYLGRANMNNGGGLASTIAPFGTAPVVPVFTSAL